MSWCSDPSEDDVISLFAGCLPNPDVPLSQWVFVGLGDRVQHSSFCDFCLFEIF
jgi:hypothetical protein